MLIGITITGADDNVDPFTLGKLSEEFPFVEWGILFSPSRGGNPRYPTPAWVWHLMSLPVISCAAHLCGQYTARTLAGDTVGLQGLSRFKRIQLNGFNPPTPEFMAVAKASLHTEWILQARQEDSIQPAVDIAREIGNASVLYDGSGGRGIAPFSWPRAPHNMKFGYAGGIRPGTVEDVLRDIGPTDTPFWIDMETGVRTGDDRFDLDRVRKVLETSQPYIVSAEHDEHP